MNRKIDIVIVSYAKDTECYNLTKECIKSLFESESDVDFVVYVVESQHDVSWSNEFPGVTTLPAPLPYGYHKFLNAGVERGDSPYVVLCNNDLIFSKGWATEILKVSDANPEVMSFSPYCPLTQSQYGIKENSGNYLGHQVRVHISGWCIFQKREIYNQIGRLDESYEHWYCDNDYAMTLHSKGIGHVLVTSSVVKHHPNNLGKTTINAIKNPVELHRLTAGASSIFQKKWASEII